MTMAAGASTSMLIAAAEALAARREGRDDLHARFARASLDACGDAGARLLRRVDSACGRLLLRLAEAAVLPGIAAHYRWRKRRIRHWVHEAIEAGARQLLVLGAGFDALGPCMAARHPSLRVLEVDRAATIAVRERALQACGIEQPRLLMRDMDFTTEGPGDTLRGLERDVPTIAVAEGLLMYLRPDIVSSLWRGVRAQCRARIDVVASAMACGEDGMPGFRCQRPWLRGWLARRGEPFAWGTTRPCLPAVMAAAGLAVTHVADPDDGRDPDPCPGEWLFRGTLLPRW
ncbi:class I SAM-dependent methyltransferase [Luteimonas soli]|uniref:Class I SAM-dependent methyltransferase n=1 Tax=Luteimonas soli TaxID=1648966 RepID=A0ABV7XNC5_9GAMM